MFKRWWKMLKTQTNYKLKNVRESRGLSQHDLSKISGVSVRVIQNFEQGQSNINGAKLRTICKLSSALRCSILDIIYTDIEIEEHFKFFENTIDSLHNKVYNNGKESPIAYKQGDFK